MVGARGREAREVEHMGALRVPMWAIALAVATIIVVAACLPTPGRDAWCDTYLEFAVDDYKGALRAYYEHDDYMLRHNLLVGLEHVLDAQKTCQ